MDGASYTNSGKSKGKPDESSDMAQLSREVARDAEHEAERSRIVVVSEEAKTFGGTTYVPVVMRDDAAGVEVVYSVPQEDVQEKVAQLRARAMARGGAVAVPDSQSIGSQDARVVIPPNVAKAHVTHAMDALHARATQRQRKVLENVHATVVEDGDALRLVMLTRDPAHRKRIVRKVTMPLPATDAALEEALARFAGITAHNLTPGDYDEIAATVLQESQSVDKDYANGAVRGEEDEVVTTHNREQADAAVADAERIIASVLDDVATDARVPDRAKVAIGALRAAYVRAVRARGGGYVLSENALRKMAQRDSERDVRRSSERMRLRDFFGYATRHITADLESNILTKTVAVHDRKRGTRASVRSGDARRTKTIAIDKRAPGVHGMAYMVHNLLQQVAAKHGIAIADVPPVPRQLRYAASPAENVSPAESSAPSSAREALRKEDAAAESHDMREAPVQKEQKAHPAAREVRGGLKERVDTVFDALAKLGGYEQAMAVALQRIRAAQDAALPEQEVGRLVHALAELIVLRSDSYMPRDMRIADAPIVRENVVARVRKMINDRMRSEEMRNEPKNGTDIKKVAADATADTFLADAGDAIGAALRGARTSNAAEHLVYTAEEKGGAESHAQEAGTARTAKDVLRVTDGLLREVRRLQDEVTETEAAIVEHEKVIANIADRLGGIAIGDWGQYGEELASLRQEARDIEARLRALHAAHAEKTPPQSFHEARQRALRSGAPSFTFNGQVYVRAGDRYVLDPRDGAVPTLTDRVAAPQAEVPVAGGDTVATHAEPSSVSAEVPKESQGDAATQAAPDRAALSAEEGRRDVREDPAAHLYKKLESMYEDIQRRFNVYAAQAQLEGALSRRFLAWIAQRSGRVLDIVGAAAIAGEASLRRNVNEFIAARGSARVATRAVMRAAADVFRAPLRGAAEDVRAQKEKKHQPVRDAVRSFKELFAAQNDLAAEVDFDIAAFMRAAERVRIRAYNESKRLTPPMKLFVHNYIRQAERDLGAVARPDRAVRRSGAGSMTIVAYIRAIEALRRGASHIAEAREDTHAMRRERTDTTPAPAHRRLGAVLRENNIDAVTFRRVIGDLPVSDAATADGLTPQQRAFVLRYISDAIEEFGEEVDPHDNENARTLSMRQYIAYVEGLRAKKKAAPAA